MNNAFRWTCLAVATVALAVFGWFGWPTPYRYDMTGPISFKTNRFSGETYRLGIQGWIKVEQPKSGLLSFVDPQ